MNQHANAVKKKCDRSSVKYITEDSKVESASAAAAELSRFREAAMFEICKCVYEGRTTQG
jgi:hypothetical protein